jgi:hypothetical protein
LIQTHQVSAKPGAAVVSASYPYVIVVVIVVVVVVLVTVVLVWGRGTAAVVLVVSTFAVVDWALVRSETEGCVVEGVTSPPIPLPSWI